MSDIFQQLCGRGDQIGDGMRQLFHFIIFVSFDLLHLIYQIRFNSQRSSFFKQDEHIDATEKVATINQILNTIFFIISFLGKTKVTKIH